MSQATPPAPPDRAVTARFFPAAFGIFLGLTLLKFGNPPIMEQWVTTPGNLYELLLGSPWPITWGYGMLGVLTLWGLLGVRWQPLRLRVLFIPLLVWLAWQFVAATQTVDAQLTGPTLAHFVACGVCFCLGYFCLGRCERLVPFWVVLLVAVLLMLAIGFDQHFGGLAQTRQYFYAYIYPRLTEVSPEYLKKMSSDRIFSTLFYPNALAGALLLFLPPLGVALARADRFFSLTARAFLLCIIGFAGFAHLVVSGSKGGWLLIALAALFFLNLLGIALAQNHRFFGLAARVFLACATLVVGLAGLACLVWSGSKGGWLLMLLIGLIGCLRLRFDRRLKLALMTIAFVVGVVAFGVKYSQFFQKGATSVVARFDYWQAALRSSVAHPWVGTGPGTFSRAYQVLKRPESEMSRLVHNDYLQQASDSGWLGFLAYTGFVGIALFCGFPRRFSLGAATDSVGVSRAAKSPRQPAPVGGSLPGCGGSIETSRADWMWFAVWLGTLGWALQGLFEFALYIPGLAWPAFAFLGLLTGAERKSVDKSRQPR